MKFILLLLPIVLCAVPSVWEVKPDFDAFMQQHGKNYAGNEYFQRLAIFRDNLVRAEERNVDGSVHGVTRFMDLSPEEFASQYLMDIVPAAALAKPCLRNGIYKPGYRNFTDYPDTWDWTTQSGVVTSVKDQASCGSCWAFSTAANIEGVSGVAKTPSGDLSPQFVVDCSKGCSWEMYQGSNYTVCNQGCSGGWPWSAFMDIINQGGIPGWSDYPYVGYDQTCKGNQGAKTLVKISSYTCIGLDKTDNEDEMAQESYNRGPLSVALYANYLQTYQKGILNPPSCTTAYLNHAVLLVGWGTENGTPYWKVKNSWGATWGESGFFRIYRGKGVCGINEAVSSANL
jgi:C1A family cysteine protease